MSEIDYAAKLETEIKKMEGVIADGLLKNNEHWTKSMNAAEAKIIALETEKKAWATRLSELEVKFKRPDFGVVAAPRLATPGQRFIMSEAYQKTRDVKGIGTEAFEVGSLFERKDAPIAGAIRGDLPPDRAPTWSQRIPEIIFEPGQRALNVMAIMNRMPTNSNLVEYMREHDITGDVEPQHSESHAKAQFGVTFEKIATPVETLAGWVPISRQVVDDAPQLQGYIDGRLLWRVNAKAEEQILFGSGAGGELLGIMNTPGVQTLGAPTGTDTNLDQIRRAIAMCRVNEYPATGIVLHPNDYCEIELLKDGDLRYIWVNVNDNGVMRLWRLPVIESTVMHEGEYLLGAFGVGAQVLDRQAATIRISENYTDYFVRNLLVILGEIRLGIAVYRPTAFVKGLLDTWTSS
jgi:HK97 family phage major capsid protein